MKDLKFYILSFLTLTFVACEKNDLCDGADVQTPRLHIALRNQFDVEAPKVAPYITAYIPGYQDTLKFVSKTDLLLPLESQLSQTKWVLTLYNSNQADRTIVGVDSLTFLYIPENIYISRACGFKTNYSAFSHQRTQTAGSWIQGVNTLTTNLTNENNIHLEFFY